MNTSIHGVVIPMLVYTGTCEKCNTELKLHSMVLADELYTKCQHCRKARVVKRADKKTKSK